MIGSRVRGKGARGGEVELGVTGLVSTATGLYCTTAPAVTTAVQCSTTGWHYAVSCKVVPDSRRAIRKTPQ